MTAFLPREIRECIQEYAEPHNASILVPEWVLEGFYTRHTGDWGEVFPRPSCPNCGLYEAWWKPWPLSGLLLTGRKPWGEGWYSLRLCSLPCEKEMEVALGLDREGAEGACSVSSDL